MAIGLPPPPTRAAPGDFVWTAWYNQLNSFLSSTDSITWSTIDKAGSSVGDLQNKAHNLLTGFQGGTSSQYYHLTSVEYTGTGTGVFVRKDSAELTGPVIFSGDVSFTGQPTFSNTTTFTGTVSFTNTTTFSSTLRPTTAGGYLSSDSSPGITTTITSGSLVGKTITIKDGLITGFA